LGKRTVGQLGLRVVADVAFCGGRVFHSRQAATGKSRSPMVLLLWSYSSFFDDTRCSVSWLFRRMHRVEISHFSVSVKLHLSVATLLICTSPLHPISLFLLRARAWLVVASARRPSVAPSLDRLNVFSTTAVCVYTMHRKPVSQSSLEPPYVQ